MFFIMLFYLSANYLKNLNKNCLLTQNRPQKEGDFV